MTRNMSTRLERLNFLLSKADFSVPSYRTVVSDTGSNLLWLKKHLTPKLETIVSKEDSTVKDTEIAKELISLLHLTIGQLKAEN